MGFIIWDRVDRKPVGASQPQWFANEDDASTHLDRMSVEEVAAGRFVVVPVPE